MKIKTVLLIESGFFIGGVIHSLFERNEKLRVISTIPQNAEALIHTIQSVKPDVVVLDDTIQQEYLDDLLLYAREASSFQIVIVNTNSNQVEVYRKQHIPFTATTDFFAVF